jgi:Skp family chaperone for outer membrane proteins
VRRLSLALLLLFGLFVVVRGEEASQEDKLRLQVVLLRGELAEALKAHAKCEAEGSAATKQLQQAQTEGQALVKALEARGLTVNQQNEIVAMPAP